MGNKKTRKNSNYKGEYKTNSSQTKGKRSADERKNLIILIVCVSIAVLSVGGIIWGAIASHVPEIYYVEMDFGEYGTIVVEADGSEAPKTAANFYRLVKRGFYDGLTIFRAQKNFVIQGGKDDSVALTPIVGEFKENGYDNNISHTRGVISMARTNDPNSATSQFFITLDDSAKSSLDDRYAAFGRVVEGMDVVDKIADAIMKCPSDSMGFVSDSDAIKIVKMTVLKKYTK